MYPNISERTPMEEIKKIHMAIWDHVIETGEKPKTQYIADCVLCEFDYLARLVSMSGQLKYPSPYTKCRLCPYKNRVRPDGRFDVYLSCLCGLWFKWNMGTELERFEYAKEIAKQIRDIEICTDEEMRERMKELREKYTPSNEV